MRIVRIVLLSMLIFSLMFLISGCRPATYYLDQICKVYGIVSVRDSDPVTPISSVEVVVNDYEYSELTNCDGRYEMELPQGTWTITFKKDGYAEQSTKITVLSDDPRQEINAELVWTAGPQDVSGYYIPHAKSGEEELQGPVFFLQQDNYELIGFKGDCYTDKATRGWIAGSEIILDIDGHGPDYYCHGTILADGSLYFENVSFPDHDGTIENFNWVEFIPQGFSFGETILAGFLVLDTQEAIGFEEVPTEYEYIYQLGVNTMTFHGRISFENESGFSEGEYSTEEDTLWGSAWDGLNSQHYEGKVIITSTDPVIAGSFDLKFPDSLTGDFLIGSFTLSSPTSSGANVSISTGRWLGVDISVNGEVSTDEPWEYFQELEDYSCRILYLTVDECIILDFESSNPLLSGQTYSVPEEVKLESCRARPGYEPVFGYTETPTSGELYIESYEEGVGIAGSFTSMPMSDNDIPMGTLSGEIDVLFN